MQLDRATKLAKENGRVPAPGKLLGLVVLTMVAFAANSVLNRLALADGQIGAVSFAVGRLASGAFALAVVAVLRQKRFALPLRGPGRIGGVVSLTLYMFGFSLAYLSLDAGMGALILFGFVQLTMFSAAAFSGDAIPRAKWAGVCLAMIGLAWLLWPQGDVAPPLVPAGMMAVAGISWGVYSLVGRRSGPALAASAANFVLATPVALALVVLLPGTESVATTPRGIGLAVLSGVVTSGLGYALWYTVLPRISTSTAALAQLSVPVIAMAGGMVFLAEPLSARFVGAACLVLTGIALGLLAPQRKIGSKTS